MPFFLIATLLIVVLYTYPRPWVSLSQWLHLQLTPNQCVGEEYYTYRAHHARSLRNKKAPLQVTVRGICVAAQEQHINNVFLAAKRRKNVRPARAVGHKGHARSTDGICFVVERNMTRFNELVSPYDIRKKKIVKKSALTAWRGQDINVHTLQPVLS